MVNRLGKNIENDLESVVMLVFVRRFGYMMVLDSLQGCIDRVAELDLK